MPFVFVSLTQPLFSRYFLNYLHFISRNTIHDLLLLQLLVFHLYNFMTTELTVLIQNKLVNILITGVTVLIDFNVYRQSLAVILMFFSVCHQLNSGF